MALQEVTLVLRSLARTDAFGSAAPPAGQWHLAVALGRTDAIRWLGRLERRLGRSDGALGSPGTALGEPQVLERRLEAWNGA